MITHLVIYVCDRCGAEERVEGATRLSPTGGLPSNWTAIEGRHLCPTCNEGRQRMLSDYMTGGN